MRLIDDAVQACAHAYEAAPADRLRAALVALADAGFLVDPQRAERHRDELRDLRNDALAIRGLLAPAGRPRRVPMELGATLAPAVEWLLAEVDRMRDALVAADKELQRASVPSAGALLDRWIRPEACAARSAGGLACTLPGGHDWAHEHTAADADAVTRWAGWSE